jgi:hypothetical protein
MYARRDEVETELHDAFGEAFLTAELRDRIDNALAELIRAERASVLDQLVIYIKRPQNGFPTHASIAR